jgi:hypothetical protein
MKPNVTIPAGYKVATKETRQSKLNRGMGGLLILELNEVIETSALVEKSTQINGEEVIVLKMLCGSTVKPERLIPLSFFNPYPTQRTELMGKSRFFKDVAEFAGTVDEFITWLENLDRKLKVTDNPRMNYTPFGETVEKSKVFYVLEYAD